MGKGSKAPTPPDPYKTASAESQFNRLDTYSPSGAGTRYGYTNAQGQFAPGTAPPGFQSAQSTVESTWERQIREALQPASVDLTKRVITDNIKGMPQAARARDTSKLATDIFNTGYKRMAPQFERENERLLQNLQNRGIPVGSEAFGDTYKQQQQSVNDALGELTMNATQAAQGEQSRLFSLDSAARSNSIAEIVAAMGGSYNPPSAVPSGAASGVNYGSMVNQNYQSQMAQYNQSQQNKSATAGALGSLGGALLMKGGSDRRIKRDIVLIGRRGPLNLYQYRYVWDAPGTIRRGFMAQEVVKLFPRAVFWVGKWMALDYEQLPEVE